jgi:hypothetical protein
MNTKKVLLGLLALVFAGCSGEVTASNDSVGSETAALYETTGDVELGWAARDRAAV